MDRLKLDKIIGELFQDNAVALEQLFNHFYPRLFGFSMTFLKSSEGIDDIIQEVFLKIWQNRKTIRDVKSFDAYIFTTAHNLLLNELRRRLHDKVRREVIYNKSVAAEFLLSDQIEFKELQEKISILIDNLPEKQRAVYQLRRLDGLSHKEIAKKLDIAEKTVEYHIRESNMAIRNGLKDFGLLAQLLFLHMFS